MLVKEDGVLYAGDLVFRGGFRLLGMLTAEPGSLHRQADCAQAKSTGPRPRRTLTHSACRPGLHARLSTFLRTQMSQARASDSL